MKFSKLFSAALVAAFVASAFASSNDTREIHAMYVRLQNAMKSKNLRVIESLEGPGFKDSERGHTMDAKQANTLMKEEFNSVTFTAFNIHVANLIVHGKTATAKTNYTMAALIHAQGKVHRMKMSGTTDDHLLKTSKGWVVTSTIDSNDQGTLDGKPMTGQ